MASKAGNLRRKAIVMAAAAAVLGAAPTFAMTHGYRGLAMVVMGIQIVLIVLALRFFVEMRRTCAGGKR